MSQSIDQAPPSPESPLVVLSKRALELAASVNTGQESVQNTVRILLDTPGILPGFVGVVVQSKLLPNIDVSKKGDDPDTFDAEVMSHFPRNSARTGQFNGGDARAA